MSRKRQKNQLELAFWETTSRGEARGEVDRGAELPRAASETEGPVSTQRLMEEVCERDNLNQALKQVRANKGSPGVDGMTVGQLPGFLKGHWPALRDQLLDGTYRPQPVRRVEIPKPDGGVRQLGIPTVLDRFIQQAVMQVLQDRWNPTFSEHSYGFRPNRSAHQAVARAQEYVAAGYRWVVDLDLEKFFDRVNHDRLMGRVAQRVADKRLLKLIRAYLEAGVMEDGLVSPTEEGTPQGGPLSPLLSNLVLDDLDKELERRGHRFVRYADDCNVYVASERAGQRVMDSLKRFITRKLKLKVNEAKSAVARPQHRKFLGFTLRRKRHIARQSRARFKARVRELTGRRGISLEHKLNELASYLRGWRQYYGFCQTPSVLERLDGWTRRRLRCALWRQWRTPRNRYAQLRRLGVPGLTAGTTAKSNRGPWRLSRTLGLCMGLSDAYFDSLGLPRLVDRRGT